MPYFIIVAVLLLAIPAYAHDMDITGLTPAQVADYQAQMLKTAQQQQVAEKQSLLDPDHLSAYAQLGKDLGQGLAATAKELGVAVNDFAASPVGKITLFLIIWKIMGNTILGVGLSVLWFAVMLPLWWHLYRRLCLVKERHPVLVEGVQARTWWGRGVWDETVYTDRDNSETMKTTKITLCWMFGGLIAIGLLLLVV